VAASIAGRWRPRLPEAWRRRFAGWLDRRVPRASEARLDRHRLFIFPSRIGFFFLGSLLVMLIAAINYENNMAFALTFLLASLFVVSVLHTHANLSGLVLRGESGGRGFPGEVLAFRVRIESGASARFALALRWRKRDLGGGEVWVDVPQAATAEVLLYARAQRRGRLRPGRILVQSVYPLGLLRCWTWVDLDLCGLVYPRPLDAPHGRASRGDAQRLREAGSGEDEFFGLRDYRPGDRPRQVFWKGLARGQVLQSKEYVSFAGSETWLDWDAYPGVGPEQRLSYLCRRCLTLHAEGRSYGLRLPGQIVAPARGGGQRERVLAALATYGETRT
jgi:uncharacterized protein (DUF58 family)